MGRFDAYDPIAAVYNRHWGYFADRIYPVLHHLVLRDLPPGCDVLDLCCGTGQLAAVFSTFDSLNHVMSLDDMERVFRNVHAVLEAGGCFEFDLNMEEGYLQRLARQLRDCRG